MWERDHDQYDAKHFTLTGPGSLIEITVSSPISSPGKVQMTW